MKIKTLVVAALMIMIVSTSVFAEKSITNEDKIEICNKVADIAASYMSMRLSDTKLSEFFGNINKENITDFEMDMLLKAYRKPIYNEEYMPIYNTEEHKNKAINEMKNQEFLNCWKKINQMGWKKYVKYVTGEND